MNINDKITASILLGAVGDAFGYGIRGNIEFNIDELKRTNYGTRNSFHFSNEYLFDIIYQGGVKKLKVKDYQISDDTIMQMGVLEGICKFKCCLTLLNMNDFMNFVINYWIQHKKKLEERHWGNRIVKSIKLLEINPKKWDLFPYDDRAGGSGASMRSSCLGLILYGIENRDLLITYSLNLGRTTHPSAIGYMGSVVSALFTAYAVENIPPKKWPFLLLQDINIEKIDSILKENKYLDSAYINQHNIQMEEFISYWKKYIDLRFTKKNKKFKYSDTYNEFNKLKNPMKRTQFYADNFMFNVNNVNKMNSVINNEIGAPGQSGHDSVIIAYDCLMDCKKNWNTLVIYSMRHAGDSDTTGTIAGSWYGAMYGLKNVPKKNYKHIEMEKELYSYINEIKKLKK